MDDAQRFIIRSISKEKIFFVEKGKDRAKYVK